MATFKKIDSNRFEKTDTRSDVTILNKEAIEKSKKFLEEQIAKFQKQLDGINANLDGIKKAK